MLQAFCLDVASVNLDVAYTCMLQAYVSSIFRCFISMFASVLSGCCICLQWFSIVFQAFSQVFHRFVSSISFVFLCMSQLLHLNISKVDRCCTWNTCGKRLAAWPTSGRRRPTTGALPCEPNALGACVQEAFRHYSGSDVRTVASAAWLGSDPNNQLIFNAVIPASCSCCCSNTSIVLQCSAVLNLQPQLQHSQK
jgi:hypothetical protein